MRSHLMSVAGAALLALGAVSGRAEEKAEPSPKIEPAAVTLGRPVEFERDVVPILDANCVACHNSIITEGKFSLESLEEMLKGGKTGTAVVAKEPDKSLLYQLAARGVERSMPPMPNEMSAKPLTPQQLGILRQWILEGAQGGSGAEPSTVAWKPLPSGLNAIYSVALSPWSRFVAAGRANQILIYDISTGTEAARLTDPHLQSAQYDGQPMYPQGAAHRDFVHALAFSPDGRLLASGGYRVVKLWQRPENVQTAKIAAPESVTAVAASADGKLVALGTANNQIKLTAGDGSGEKLLAGHAGAVSGLAFTPDGSLLVSGAQDKAVRIWKTADGTEQRKFDTPAPINDIALNKEGNRIITAHQDNLIRVWDLVAPAEGEVKPVLEIKGHGGPVTSVEVVLPAGNQLLSGSEDGTLRIWDLNNGNQQRSMGHGGPVTDVAARFDGAFVASAGANNIAKLWQANNGQQKAELKGDANTRRKVLVLDEAKQIAQQMTGIMTARQAAADKNLKDREAGLKTAQEAKNKAEKELAEPEKKAKEAADKLQKAKEELAKKADDTNLQKAVQEAEKANQQAQDALKKVQDALEGAKRSLEFATQAVERVKKDLETANAEKAAAEQRQKQAEAELAEAQKAAQAAEKPFRAIAFAPESTLLATGGDAGLVQLWNGETGQPLEAFVSHGGPVAALAFTAGNRVVSGSADKTAVVWDANPQWKLVAQLGPKADDPLNVSASPFVGRVLALDFSPDGKRLATGGGDPSRSGELMIWDVEKREILHNIADAHSDTVLGVEFSRDGQYLLSGAADKFAKIHETSTGKHVRSFEGHTHHVLDVSWKADGQTIVTAGADNAIKIWTVETGEQQRTINNYQKQVTSIQFIGTGENLVSCGGDKTVRFHKSTNGQNYRNFGGMTDYVYSAAAARDESLVVAGGEDGVLRVWDGKTAQVVRQFEPPKPTAADTQQASAK